MVEVAVERKQGVEGMPVEEALVEIELVVEEDIKKAPGHSRIHHDQNPHHNHHYSPLALTSAFHSSPSHRKTLHSRCCNRSGHRSCHNRHNRCLLLLDKDLLLLLLLVVDNRLYKRVLAVAGATLSAPKAHS